MIADGVVKGVTTGDLGVAKDGHHKDSFTPGINLLGKYTLFAEGARGSLTKQLLALYKLGEGRDYQKFGIGVKELWELPPDKHKKGLVLHSFGWPLSNDTGGGLFCYHWARISAPSASSSISTIPTPYLSPFDEMQRVKQHPRIRAMLEGGKRIGYGARALTEGGLQSVPKLAFPGGALVGCAAGFMNVPRIKGSHNAMKSGMLAAEAVAAALGAGRSGDTVDSYEGRPIAKATSTRTSSGCGTSSRYGPSSALPGAAVHGARPVDQPALRIFLFWDAEPRQAGLCDAENRRPIPQDRLSQAGRRYQFRQTFVGILVQHQP
ncbi:MAG: NAD(P)/FAD-dependent oxidoreductase [Rhizomicrobium sp.]